MSIDIDAAFADLDTDDLYPGSRRRRRSVEHSTREVEPSWDARPTIKIYNGQETEFYNTGAVAQALGKSTVTVRLWERKGYLPTAPFRLPGYTNSQGKEVPGRRLYSRALIEVLVDEFNQRGLLGKRRVDWDEHHDLTVAIAERWQAILNEEK
jgi:hypothetical protein